VSTFVFEKVPTVYTTYTVTDSPLYFTVLYLVIMPPQEQNEVPSSPSWVEINNKDNGGTGMLLNDGSGASREALLSVRMEQLDPYNVPIRRRSIFHRESFLVQFASKPGPRSIIILMVCVAMGVGSTIGVVPAVMMDRYARLNHGYNEAEECALLLVKPQACLDGSADAQNASAMSNLVSNGLTFATSSLMGSLSDEHGRRLLMVMGVFLSLLSPVCLVFMQLIPSMSPWWYYAARACTGLINWIAVALSSLSDVMPPEWRAASFGMLLAGLFLGFAMSPQLSLLMTHFHVSVLAAAVVLFGFVYAVFCFPETLPPERAAIASQLRQAQVEGMTPTERLFWNLKRPAWELSILNRNQLFRLLSVLAFFSGMVSSGDQTLLLYYVEERLAFNDHDVATMFLIMGLLGIFAQAVLLKPFIECVGERLVVTFCFLVGAADNFMYGIAKDKTLVFVAMGLGSLTNMSFPTISAIKANNVNESEQGRIQGALYSVQALASGTGPMAMRCVYHFTKDGAFMGPGSMFVFASTLMVVASGCAFALPKDKADSRRQHDRQENVPDGNGDENESTPFVVDGTDSVSSGSYGGIDEA